MTEATTHPDPPVGTCRYAKDGKAVAIRTELPNSGAGWGLMTTHAGGGHVTADVVYNDDLWQDTSPLIDPPKPKKTAKPMSEHPNSRSRRNW